MTVRRKTEALIKVATALMETPDERHWGYETAKAAGVRSATLYRVLDRMHKDGWVADGWENPTVQYSGRPPRRYYTVTELGRTEMSKIVPSGADAGADLNVSTLRETPRRTGESGA